MPDKLEDPRTDQPARSPRRGPARTRAILEATLELLGEVGYEQLTIDAVAARAHASKTTIYRRWDEKRDLVIAALEQREATHPDLPDDAETLRDDLLALVRLLGAIADSEDARVFSGLLYVSQRDPVIARVFREQLLERRRADCRAVVQRAIARKELPAETPSDPLFELLIGHVMVRSVLQGRALDNSDLIRLVDDIAMPVLGAGATAQSDKPSKRRRPQ